MTRRDLLRRAGAIAAAPGALSLAGCWSKEPDDGKTHLRYMAWGAPEQLETEEMLISRFEKANPDVKVKLFKVPSSAYRNKMIVMLASRTAPDVIRVDHYDFPQLVRRDYFHDLSEFAANDPDFSEDDFFDWTMEECKHEGKLFGLNTLSGGVIVYYNKSMAKGAGLEDPFELHQKGEWTWDRLREHAIAMTKRRSDGRVERFGFQIPGFVNQASLIWGYGADYLSQDMKTCLLDSPQAVAAYQFLMDLRWKHHVAPTPAQAAQAAFTFESGKIGMEFNWMGMSPRYRQAIRSFEWDVCPCPRGPVAEATAGKGNQLVMYAETQHPEAAWRFIRFMTSYETEQFICGKLRRAGPTRKAVAYSEEFLETELPPFNTRAFVTAIERSRRLPINERWQEWTVVVGQYLDQLYTGKERDVATVLRRMKMSVDAVLQEEEGF